MKYLNNKKTGEVIEIEKIKENAIVYNVFENSYYAENGQFSKQKVCNLLLDDIEITCENKPFSEVKLQAAMIMLTEFEIDFEISADWQNWNIKKNHLENDTLFRVLIPKNIYNKALEDRNNESGNFYYLWQIINYVVTTLPPSTANITDNCFTQYLSEIEPEHLAVLEMYKDFGVVIEERE